MSARRDELLAAVLNLQTDILDDEALEAFGARMAAYAVGGALDAVDANLVWRSPAARALFLHSHRHRVASVRDAWNRAGFGLELVQRAADSSDDQRTISNAGMTLRLLRSQGLGDWIISLELTPDAAAILSPGVRIRLVDTGGRVWLEGEPDANLGLDAFWTDADESPVERLREHRITLELA